MFFRFVDLFSGIGGFRLAGESLGGKCVFSCEIDKTAQEVYYKNFGDIPYPDIRKLSEFDIPDFDILFAGFPCQPFSIAGLKAGFGDLRNGDLFFHIVRILRYKQPKAFILENVKNFISVNGGEDLSIAINTLNSIGYKVYFSILNSKYFGVAQNRERLFIVGIHKDFKEDFHFPKGSKDNFLVLEDILDNEKNIPAELLYNADYQMVKSDLRGKVFKPYKIGIVNKGRQGERIYSIKGLSITISHSTGGVFSKTGGYLTPQGIRKLTVNEVKRLFSFPEDFNFDDVSYNKAISLLGNSVVLNVVKAILQNVIPIISTVYSYKRKKEILYIKG